MLGDFFQLPGVDFYVADHKGNVQEEFKKNKVSKEIFVLASNL